VLLLSVLILKIIWFSGIPVLVCDRFSCGHPEELSLLRLVSTAGPEVLVSHTITLNMFLQILLFSGCVDTGKMHAVEPTILLSFVPVGLEENSKVVSFVSQLYEWHGESAVRCSYLVLAVGTS